MSLSPLGILSPAFIHYTTKIVLEKATSDSITTRPNSLFQPSSCLATLYNITLLTPYAPTYTPWNSSLCLLSDLPLTPPFFFLSYFFHPFLKESIPQNSILNLLHILCLCDSTSFFDFNYSSCGVTSIRVQSGDRNHLNNLKREILM